MIKSIRLSAIVPSTDIEGTKKFLVESLGFEDVPMMSEIDTYAIAKTSNTELHLQAVSNTPNEMSLYLLVESADEAWQKIKDLKGIKMKAPFVQDYGMKEVHVVLPHTNTLVFVGEDVG